MTWQEDAKAAFGDKADEVIGLLDGTINPLARPSVAKFVYGQSPSAWFNPDWLAMLAVAEALDGVLDLIGDGLSHLAVYLRTDAPTVVLEAREERPGEHVISYGEPIIMSIKEWEKEQRA